MARHRLRRSWPHTTQQKVGSHGQRFPDRGPSSGAMAGRHVHVIDLDGAHRDHRLVPSEVVVTRPGRTHGQKSTDRGYYSSSTAPPDGGTKTMRIRIRTRHRLAVRLPIRHIEIVGSSLKPRKSVSDPGRLSVVARTCLPMVRGFSHRLQPRAARPASASVAGRSFRVICAHSSPLPRRIPPSPMSTCHVQRYLLTRAQSAGKGTSKMKVQAYGCYKTKAIPKIISCKSAGFPRARRRGPELFRWKTHETRHETPGLSYRKPADSVPLCFHRIR